jgi:transposase
MILSSLEQKLQFVQGKGVAGIDVAPAWHYGQGLRPDGRPLARALRIPNTRAGFDRLLAFRPTPDVVIGLEPTGPYWLPLAPWLAAQPGVTVVLVNPAHVKRAKELDDNTPTKSDAKDAGVIARLVHQGRFLTWTPRPGPWANLQSLAVLRHQQRQAVSQWETRLAGWLVHGWRGRVCVPRPCIVPIGWSR